MGRTRKKKAREKLAGREKEKKRKPPPPPPPPISPVFSRFIFVFALSQFSGPDYLGAWNRLMGSWLFTKTFLKFHKEKGHQSDIFNKTNQSTVIQPLSTFTSQKELRITAGLCPEQRLVIEPILQNRCGH